jgi:hypothetical protein
MKATILATAVALSSFALAAPSAPYGGKCEKKDDYPGKDQYKKDYFTSFYSVVATPDQVVNTNSVSTPGEAGAVGYYKYAINSREEVICYVSILLSTITWLSLTSIQDIVHKDVTGPYQSPARTATHIHQAAKGLNGPPRIAFPNPVGDDKFRQSKGCLKGPFVTGINVTGSNPPVDTGSASGFKLSLIEANPAGFFTDAHTTLFTAGVFRAQLA